MPPFISTPKETQSTLATLLMMLTQNGDDRELHKLTEVPDVSVYCLCFISVLQRLSSVSFVMLFSDPTTGEQPANPHPTPQHIYMYIYTHTRKTPPSPSAALPWCSPSTLSRPSLDCAQGRSVRDAPVNTNKNTRDGLRPCTG